MQFIARRQDSAPCTPRMLRRPVPPASLGDPEMTNIFAVVGEHRENPDHLLVLGDDGTYYDYALTTGQTAATEPDESWCTDAHATELEEERLR